MAQFVYLEAEIDPLINLPEFTLFARTQAVRSTTWIAPFPTPRLHPGRARPAPGLRMALPRSVHAGPSLGAASGIGKAST